MPGSGRKEKQWAAKKARWDLQKVDWRNAGTWYESERFVPTADDWHPCYFLPWGELGEPLKCMDWDKCSPMVRGLVFMHPPNYAGQDDRWFVRICFWGNDDTGIEKDAYFSTKEAAYDQYQEWVGYLSRLALASYYDFLKLGFQHA